MQKTETSKDIIIYEGLDMGLRLEYNHTYVIIHMKYVHKFNYSSYKKLLELRDSLSMFLKTVGYEVVHAAIPKTNHKMKKLVSLVGFKYIGTKDGMDIYIYGDN